MANNNRRGSSYRQMQQVLESQEQVNQQLVTTLAAMTNASNVMSIVAGSLIDDGNLSKYTAQSNSQRPTMGSNQSRRHTPSPYDYSPTGQYQNPGYGRGLHGVRRSATSALERRFGTSSGPTYERINNEAGQHVGWRATAADGTVTYHPTWGVSDAELAGASARSTTSGVLGAMGEGGLMAGVRAVPYVGAAIVGAEALHEGVTFVSNQRAANAQYQSIYNGTNLQGMGQRYDQLGFQVGQLFGGGLSWGQSQQAFQGVSALGYQGAQRSSDLNFITSNYKSMGVDVADSLKLITTAASDLNESLSGLQQGLQQTRAAAAGTGQNANVGTQIYQQNYAQMAQQYAGPGVATVAGNLSTIQASMGRYMSSFNLTAMLNDPAQVATMAAHAGMTPTQFVDAVQQGNSSVVMRAVDQRISAATAPMLESPDVQRIIRNSVSRLGNGSYQHGLQALNIAKDPTDDLQVIAHNLMRSGKINAYTLQANIRATTGQTVPLEQAVMMSLRGDTGLNHALTDPVKYKDNTSAIVGMRTPLTWTRDRNGHMVRAPGAGQVHYNVGSSNVNPVIQAVSGQYDDDRRVIVKDGKNGERVVTLGIAKQYYSDQIADGTAKLAANRTSLAQLVGKAPDKNFMYASDWAKKLGTSASNITGAPTRDTEKYAPMNAKAGTDSEAAKTEAGRTLSSYSKQNNTKIAAAYKRATGKVTVEPSPELQSLLRFVPSGNVDVAYQNAATNSVPVPGQ